MHPFQSEIHARNELEARWHDAEQRRLRAADTSTWSVRAGALLVAVGDGLRRSGQRLQQTRRADVGCTAACAR